MVEATSCAKGRNSIFLEYKGSEEALKEIFPSLVILDTLNEITNTDQSGVYATKGENGMMIRIFGGCPNFSNGECRLNNDCIVVK